MKLNNCEKSIDILRITKEIETIKKSHNITRKKVSKKKAAPVTIDPPEPLDESLLSSSVMSIPSHELKPPTLAVNPAIPDSTPTEPVESKISTPYLKQPKILFI